jgi:pimeloyl-ACP methyl ester carboxylesterase
VRVTTIETSGEAATPRAAARPQDDGLVAAPLDPRWRALAPPEWLEHWSVERVAVDGGEVEVVEAGDGPPLVLLPPMPGWKEAYVALLPLLAERFRVVTFDLRTRFSGRPGWTALVVDAERIAAARFGATPVHVFGHSLGGALALRWAIDHPARMRSLVVSSGFSRVWSPPGGRFARWVEQPLALAAMRWLPDPASGAVARELARRRRWVFDAACDERAVALVRFGVRRAPLGLLRERLALAFRFDVRAALDRLGVPTLVLCGEHDTEFARRSLEELAAAIPGARRGIVAGAGHLHPLSRPRFLADSIVPFLESPRDSTHAS